MMLSIIFLLILATTIYGYTSTMNRIFVGLFYLFFGLMILFAFADTLALNQYKKEINRLKEIRYNMDEHYEKWNSGGMSREEFAKEMLPYKKEIEEKNKNRYMNFRFKERATLNLYTLVTLSDIVGSETKKDTMSDGLLRYVYTKRTPKFIQLIKQESNHYTINLLKSMKGH